MGKRQQRVFKRQDVEYKKSETLVDYCSDKAFQVIDNYVGVGAVFILMPNGEHTPVKEFYKALWNEMMSPTYNGASIYDARVSYHDAWDRPVILITLNDYGNYDIVERIQLLGPRRHTTLYSIVRED